MLGVVPLRLGEMYVAILESCGNHPPCAVDDDKSGNIGVRGRSFSLNRYDFPAAYRYRTVFDRRGGRRSIDFRILQDQCLIVMRKTSTALGADQPDTEQESRTGNATKQFHLPLRRTRVANLHPRAATRIAVNAGSPAKVSSL